MKAQVYKVGGAVRDALLNRPVSETDWVVVGSTPQAMLDAGYKQVGKDFPVFLHPETGEEYALARTERKRGRGYHGFDIDAAPDVTLEEDLKRRDLTVNAMAMDAAGELIDPYGGREDLDNRLLRHVSPAFAEDPLRVLRTARFAARYHHLGFSIADETRSLMRELSESGELETLARERVWQEIQKGLNEHSPQILLSSLLDCRALQELFPAWAESLNDEVLSALARAHACKLDNETRFALACVNLSLSDTQQLCKALVVPKTHAHLARLYQEVQLLERSHGEAETLLATLEKSDALRRPELIKQLCALEHCRTGLDYSHYLHAAQAMRSVDSRELIDQGYSGVALGEALRAKRMEKIQEHL